MTKVAAIQMNSSSIVDFNLLSAESFIKEAAQQDAKLIVLPEMFAIMGNIASDKVDEKEQFRDGKIQTFLSQQAKNHGVWIIGGTIPIASDHDNKIKAASIVFDDQGHIVARYDKIHLFDVQLSDEEIYKESDTTEAGQKIVTVDSPFGTLGLAVCYDIRFPELFRYLFNQGMEILSLPSAFTVPTGTAHWEVLVRSTAIENFCYVIAACQGGTHTNGRKTYGHSLIVSPWGEILAEKKDVTPGVIYADIDLKKIHEARRAIPIKNHQKIFFDLSRLT